MPPKCTDNSRVGYSEIHRCRICGSSRLAGILDLGIQALTGVFPKSREEEVPRAPLSLVKCMAAGSLPACGLVQLRHSCEGSELYGSDYGYRSGLNASMVSHLHAVAQRVKQTVPLLSGDVVLDIGSNDGTFLRAMREPGVLLVGMDPTGSKFGDFYPADIQLIPEFFSADRFRAETSQNYAKAVTSIAMFYDLEDPIGFMRQVEQILVDDGIWLFEQSYLPRMLDTNSYDTVCHEHLEYYALRQILYMAERAGLKILDVELNNINGGSFSIIAAKLGSKYTVNSKVLDQILRKEEDLGLDNLRVFDEFATRVVEHRARIRQFFTEARRADLRVFGYGASTKGNVLLQYCGVTPSEMACIADVNQDKHGSFTPGTRIPIVSEDDARRQRPDVYFVLPWHFRDHILKRENAFLEAGHKIVFPLPQLETVTLAKSTYYR